MKRLMKGKLIYEDIFSESLRKICVASRRVKSLGKERHGRGGQGKNAKGEPRSKGASASGFRGLSSLSVQQTVWSDACTACLGLECGDTRPPGIPILVAEFGPL